MMELASRVAVMSGDSVRVEKYKKLRGEIAAAFNRELWVEDQRLYRDGKPFQTSVKPGKRKWLPADKDIETFSPRVNLLAVFYDLAPRENQSAIVEKVLAEKPLNTQPWFIHWVFQAMDHSGIFDKYGTEQMRRWQIVRETQSFRETWSGGEDVGAEAEEGIPASGHPDFGFRGSHVVGVLVGQLKAARRRYGRAARSFPESETHPKMPPLRLDHLQPHVLEPGK